MSDVAVPEPQSFGWLDRPKQLFTSAFQGIHGIGLKLTGFGYFVGRSFSRGVRWMGWRSLKGLEALFMRHRSSRRVTQNVARGSGATAGFIPVDGSQTSAGASRNVQEILQIIDDSLQAGIGEGTWTGVTDGLEEVTEATSNSKLPDDTKDCNFLRTIPNLTHLVQLAAKCSKAAYGDTETSGNEQSTATNAGPSLKVLDVAKEVSKSSLDGTIKACMITLRTTGEDQLLVVAIRGTVSLVDWLVNLDGDLELTGDFLDLECDEPVKAHRGLLRVAKRMLPAICSKIKSECQALVTPTNTSKKSLELLFTGHSAGGGVAALICAHIRNHCPEIIQSVQKTHCITFAAPPVLAPHSAVTTDVNATTGVTLNMMNYGDIVPRAEKNYIRSLLALYTERVEHPSGDPWDFGRPTTFNYGHIVILQDTSEDEDGRALVHAYRISQDLWQTLAFGSIRAHPMAVYLEAVDEFVVLHS